MGQEKVAVYDNPAHHPRTGLRMLHHCRYRVTGSTIGSDIKALQQTNNANYSYLALADHLQSFMSWLLAFPREGASCQASSSGRYSGKPCGIGAGV